MYIYNGGWWCSVCTGERQRIQYKQEKTEFDTIKRGAPTATLPQEARRNRGVRPGPPTFYSFYFVFHIYFNYLYFPASCLGWIFLTQDMLQSSHYIYIYHISIRRPLVTIYNIICKVPSLYYIQILACIMYRF